MATTDVVALAVYAPLCALVPRDDSTIHAVTMESIIGVLGEQPMVSACGIEGVKIMPVPLDTKDPVPWPPAVKGIPAPFTRCRPCQKATGGKRPRCRFAVTGEKGAVTE